MFWANAKYAWMKRLCFYTIIMAMVGCGTHLSSEEMCRAESTLAIADSLENTSTVYTDTMALRKALNLYQLQENHKKVAKTHYHLGNAYKAFGEDSLAFASYMRAADGFLVVSDSVYYPLSVLEMCLIAEQKYKEDGNATMLQAIRTLQREMTRDRAEDIRWKLLGWLLLIVIVAGIGVALLVIKRRKPVMFVSVVREDLERNIELLLSQGKIQTTLHWSEYPQFCKTANAYLYHAIDKLQATESQLSEQDIRFLVLVLLNLSAKEIADVMNLSQNSISNKKTRTAQKLGTIAADLRETIIGIILKSTQQ